MESAHTRDCGKEAETQELGNGFERDAAKQMPNLEKGAQPQSVPTSVMESISGEFALVISGHSLVSDSCWDLIGDFVKKGTFNHLLNRAIKACLIFASVAGSCTGVRHGARIFGDGMCM